MPQGRMEKERKGKERRTTTKIASNHTLTGRINHFRPHKHQTGRNSKNVKKINLYRTSKLKEGREP